MPAKTFTQLTNIDEQNIDNANDVFAVWDNAHATDSPQAKQLKAKNVLTSPDTSVSLQTSPAVSTTGNVSRVVCVDQTGYNNLSPKDSNTLYVITDGVTLDSYNGQIDTPTDRTYILDPKVVSPRKISGFYATWTAGTGPAGTIDLQVGGTTVLTATGNLATASPFTGSIVSTGAEDITQAELDAGTVAITLVLSGSTANVTDLAFTVEYEV